MQLFTLASLILAFAAATTSARDTSNPACDRPDGSVSTKTRQTSQPVVYIPPGSGACEFEYTNEDLGVCVSPGYVHSGYANHCGAKVQVSYGGQTVQVKVVDVCGAASDCDDLFLTEKAFKQLGGSTAKGRLDGPVTWNFVN
ncbi:hypothetical protein CF327_g5817 [Tilletia walkeri]|uniref:RlpA-like protein double-psi beta-barrel domain-containing protein n=1 Tax=Tilletia walkeri TaxID=117179 RepID=A0A8X7N5Q8_9BASI|nr:hypothetical protein CF327_g5817 [Tilletia walkeri]KAE8267094.1 hypothetical protein A4X09_0g5251 [Tilletia walkeri]